MNKIDKVVSRYSQIQESICKILETIDGQGAFSTHKWYKDIGFGETKVLIKGNILEKAAVNFSKVSGKLTQPLLATLGINAETYSVTGISSIIHSSNPFVPTIHMNVRYFELNNGKSWFGGGIDLTPTYVDINEAANFHRQLKEICDRYNPSFYNKFKTWADDYFFINHRNETRGIGGIFFDYLEPSPEISFENIFKFSIELANAYPEIYSDIIECKRFIIFNKKHKDWQKLRRGRYVEFNLLYDRGTKFGLDSGGNTESILVSLPGEVNWEYKHTPKTGSEEEKTLTLLKKGIDWVNR